MGTRLRVLVAGALGLGLLAPPARGDGDLSGWPLVPVSGADGAFETVTAGGVTSWRPLRGGTGSYAPYLYFRAPDAARAPEGPVSSEVRYRDLGWYLRLVGEGTKRLRAGRGGRPR